MIEISTDKNRLEITTIHQFLTNSYWAKGRTINDVKSTIEHCFCFGLYLNKKQIGFARIATDYTVFAYIMDVFVLPDYRGNGYSKQLMAAVMSEPKLQKCTVWMLKTADAHGLYEQFGFSKTDTPERIMQLLKNK
jgi:GNAT superfamily N-acetyltransferase